VEASRLRFALCGQRLCFRHANNRHGNWHLCRYACGRLCVRCAGETVHKMVRRPGAGELHLALPHHGAGSCELALIAFDILPVDQMSDIQHHLAAFGQPAAYLFIQRQEEPAHLEADRAGSGLALTVRAALSRRLVRYCRPAPSNGACRSSSRLQQPSTMIFRCISVLPRSLSILPRNWRWFDRMDLRRLSSSWKTVPKRKAGWWNAENSQR